MSAPPYAFDANDADVILRAPLPPESEEKFKDFRVHKLILSIASTIFNDMFSIPQPPQPATGTVLLPTVTVVESAKVFETFLRLIYPIEPPAIYSLQLVDDLFRLSEKYMTNVVHEKLKQILVSPIFIESDPVWVYAIACRADLGMEAELAIPHTFRIDPVRDVPRARLQMMTAETYNSLLVSHANRRSWIIYALGQVVFPSSEPGGCGCGYPDWFYARLFKDLTIAVWEKPFLDRERLDSCLSVFEMPESECGLGASCAVSPQAIARYFTSILNEIERSE